MRFFNVLAGMALVAPVQPLIAQYAPPAYPQAGDPAAGRLEQLLWEGAARSNNADGYQTYLRRYPNGAHSDQARDALDRLYGRPPARAYPQQAPDGYPPAAAPPQDYREQAVPAPASPPPSQPQPQLETPPPSAEPMATLPEPAAPPPAESAPEPTPPAAVPPPVRRAAAGSPLFLCRPVFAGGITPYEQAGEAEIAAYLAALKVNSVAAYKAFLQAHPHGAFSSALSELIATREARARALAAATVPGPTQAKARAPLTIAADDYPEGAAQAGSATAVWEVGEDGCVQSCRIEKSSGSPALDTATCRIVSARGTYEPARDAGGKPIRSIETGTFGWNPPAR